MKTHDNPLIQICTFCSSFKLLCFVSKSVTQIVTRAVHYTYGFMYPSISYMLFLLPSSLNFGQIFKQHKLLTKPCHLRNRKELPNSKWFTRSFLVNHARRCYMRKTISSEAVCYLSNNSKKYYYHLLYSFYQLPNLLQLDSYVSIKAIWSECGVISGVPVLVTGGGGGGGGRYLFNVVKRLVNHS